MRVVRGDRESGQDMGRLASGGSWDAVVDTSGYAPGVVEAAAGALRGHAGRYVLISTVNLTGGGRRSR